MIGDERLSGTMYYIYSIWSDPSVRLSCSKTSEWRFKESNGLKFCRDWKRNVKSHASIATWASKDPTSNILYYLSLGVS